MKIRRLQLKGFRNYGECDIELSPDVTLLSGSNAQGKTNLLEGLYALSSGTSFRTSKDSEMVKWEDEAAWIKGHISGAHSDFTMTLSISSAGRKMARLNDVERMRPSALSDRLNVVAFIPDDLNLVKGSPSDRRKFLDLHISQMSPRYREDLNIYSKVVAQKNALLKAYHEMEGAARLLDVFNEEMVKVGTRIIGERADALIRMTPFASETYSFIAGSDEDLSVRYMPSVEAPDMTEADVIASRFSDKLWALRPAEIARGACLAGPQRDDLGLEVSGRPAAMYGSQGQQRTVVVSLKLAEAEIIATSRGEAPVVLLDDVLSELDEGRKGRLISRFIGRCQTVVTATDSDVAFSMPGCLAYRVTAGSAVPA